MKEKGFTYFAFISYSHKDQKTARKLKKFLEKYHLPSSLQKTHPNLPRKLNPIFIDESNLAGPGPLEKNLRANLEESKYLIVICSPNSAQSKYVNDEVSYFIKYLNRTDKIIPLIVDGTPHSEDPSKECFPAAILELPRELEPLGIDLKVHGEYNSFLRVIAAMLELKPGKFIPWEERERRKRRIIFSSIAAAFAFVAGILIWYNIPHRRYYRAYSYRWEKPVGLFEVTSESDRMKMEYTYRFTELRGEVKMIERVNSAGTLVDPSVSTPLNELPMIRFVSDRTVEYYDLDGHKVYRKVYTPNMQAADFYSAGEGDFSYALPSDMYNQYDMDKFNPELSNNQENAAITRLTLEYDKRGHVIKKMFRRDNSGGRDERGTPAQDSKGRWGLGYEYDGIGRITAVHYLDRDGQIMSVNGVCSEYTEYGDSPYPMKMTRADKNGNPALDPNGAAFDTVSFDEHFNPVMWSNFGLDGERVMHRQYNISAAVFTFGKENGFMASASFYDTQLAPCQDKNEGSHRIEISCNKEGRRIEVSNYDVNGRKTICSEGHAVSRIEYDDEGRISRASFYDTEGRPAVYSSSNAYCYKYSYEDGYMTRVDYLDAKGNPMLNKYGYASAVFSYDKDKNKSAGTTFFDTEGRKVLTSNGIAEVRYTYYRGNKASQAYYDENGKPIPDSEGVAKYIYDWENGNLISTKCFDSDGKLTMNKDGYARADNKYDENGLKIWTGYYDSDGKRVMLSAGYSAISCTYNNLGQQTAITYYDADDKHAVKADEHFCCMKEYEYYDSGKIKRIHYVKDKDSPYRDMLGNLPEYVCYEYDRYGNRTKEYWLNANGEEVMPEKGFFKNGTVRYEKEYDIYGRQKKILQYRKGENVPWIIDEYERDSFGRTISQSAVRHAGGREDAITEKREYDSYGRRMKTYWLDIEGRLFIPDNHMKGVSALNYAVKRERHDIFGYETDAWYYDENEKPLSSDKRAFHIVKTFDPKGNVLSESYYHDENEDSPAEISGVHRKEFTYNASGAQTGRRQYSADGKLLNITYGKRSGSGKLLSTEMFDGDGNPLFNESTGAFKTVYAYDSYGNRSDTWYFDADGQPCARMYKGRPREHHQRISHDAMGKVLSVEFFDKDEKPAPLLRGGAYKWLNVYDSYGLRTEMSLYGENQKLSARRLFTYDSSGNKTGDEWIE